MTITKITDHQQQGIKRLISQYKEKASIESLLNTYFVQIKELENLFFDLLNNRNIQSAIGLQLDNLGTILGEPRNGTTDDIYRVLLLTRITRNNSEGTPEDLIGIFNTIMGAVFSIYYEIFPAEFNLIAVNPTPIIPISSLRSILEQAKPAGVDLVTISQTGGSYFGFQADQSPNASGFGDTGNSGIGGDFTEIIVAPLTFSFSDDLGSFRSGFGDVNDPKIGGRFFKFT